MKKLILIVGLVFLLTGCSFVKKTFDFAFGIKNDTPAEQARKISDAVNEGAKLFSEDIKVDFKDIQNPDFSITTPSGKIQINDKAILQMEEAAKKIKEQIGEQRVPRRGSKSAQPSSGNSSLPNTCILTAELVKKHCKTAGEIVLKIDPRERNICEIRALNFTLPDGVRMLGDPDVFILDYKVKKWTDTYYEKSTSLSFGAEGRGWWDESLGERAFSVTPSFFEKPKSREDFVKQAESYSLHVKNGDVVHIFSAAPRNGGMRASPVEGDIYCSLDDTVNIAKSALE